MRMNVWREKKRSKVLKICALSPLLVTKHRRAVRIILMSFMLDNELYSDPSIIPVYIDKNLEQNVSNCLNILIPIL